MGTLAICHAQTENQGSLALTGAISITTCVLDFGEASSTLSGRKTLAFGSIPTSKIPTGKYEELTQIPSQTVIFSVKSANGTACDGIGSGKWDVAIDIPALVSESNTNDDTDVLLAVNPQVVNTALIKELGLVLATTKNSNLGETKVRFRKNKLYTPPGSNTAYTLLSSSTATTPGLSATDTLALTVNFMTTSTEAGRTPGAYSTAVPLFVFYK